VCGVTENAIDLIIGAASFDQIDRMWSFANAERSQGVMSALSQEADLIAAAIKPRVKKVDVGDYKNFVRNLLRDPSEIWRHAYEQEISDAGRSLLLALYTLGGKAHGAVLKTAFTVLHKARAERYGFQRWQVDNGWIKYLDGVSGCRLDEGAGQLTERGPEIFGTTSQ
jgi:hypothetical protein